jgi:hypothetical protein
MISVEKFGEAILIREKDDGGSLVSSCAIRRDDITAINMTVRGVSFIIGDAVCSIDYFNQDREASESFFFDALLLGFGLTRNQ